ncbi:MAG: 4-hydroxy-3-methylbut-2-enyl diphosphate reductase [Lachnospiraceae bacterium]|nr:4-hydroxy-3-methylbut-2-enyl diphosphate reductase [Lachnospiraceae bacterium]
MEVKLAKTAGFCFGVKRAVDTVYEQVDHPEQTPIYTFGPIIHNEEVIADLEKKGVITINSEEELKQLYEGTMIIRSHGVGEHIYDVIKEQNLHLVDATCPFVKKIHRIVKDASEEGNYIIIIGNKNHPEVQGICGWCHGDCSVVSTEEEIRALALPKERKVTVVSQTTFNLVKFKYLVAILENICYNLYIVNTICNATQERQAEARKIASSVDAMIVIGGKNSSNTQKLYEICKKECGNTCYIQTLKDLSAQNFQTVCTVGITAGASTPKHIIEEVQLHVRTNF